MVVATQMSPIRVEKIREIKIPTIDLSGKESQVSKLIVEACEEYGFFNVINHGVPHHIIQTMEDESFDFFRKPLSEKQRVGLTKPFGYGNKNIGLSGDTGELEYLLLQTNQNAIDHTSKLVSNSPSKFSSTVSRYVEVVRGLACEILGVMAKGIGVPPSLFTTLLTDHDSDSLFRLNHYPLVTDTSSSSSFHHGNAPIGFGEHSDPQILTLLTSNGVPGLQILLGNGVWVPVNSDPKAFCVIVGDLLQVMTNGRFKSVRHRAMANTSSRECRLSMVFFGGPPPQTIITCPPQLLKPNKPPLYKPFTWAEYKSHTYAHRLGETRLDHFKLP
ncbi:gibberellin 2-beta-dioxygenase 2 [Lactuca sativa]|uniref:gibberellin 2-beta-dioxygenase 2 n=1 Tax=Lactuca sativa TaxID=4236 RepID=UPI000CCB58C9|nr:gibberellin 2-beta-dioxygenase 2 [Lactuca sativa]